MAGVGSQGYLFEVYSQADFFNCDVQGGPDLFGGSGGGVAFFGAWEQCLNTIPGFMGSGEFPYSLGDNSPCIDMGSPDTSGFMLPETDLAGNPRVMNNRIDMGAYEWFTVGVDEKVQSVDPVRVWPNPFSDRLWIKLNLEKNEEVVVGIFDFSGRLIYSAEKTNLQAG